MKNLVLFCSIILCMLISTLANAQVVISNVVSNPVYCFGGSDGNIAVTATGNGALTYSINGMPSGSSQTFTNLVAGVYTVVVADALLNTSSTVVTVTQPSQIIITGVAGTILCQGGSANVSLTTNGGVGIITTSPNPNGLVAGTYTFTATDANGCTATTLVTIIAPTVQIVISSSVSGCPLSGFTICATPTGGLAPYTYSYAFANTIIGNCAIVQPSSLGTSTYTIICTDANGCSGFGTTSINVTNLSTINTVVTQPTCANINNSVCATVSNPSSVYTYSIDSVNFNVSNCFANLPIGSTIIYVKDTNNCIGLEDVNIVLQNTMTATSQIIKDSSCVGGLSTCSVMYNGGTPPYSVLWNSSPTQTTDTVLLPSGSYTCTVSDVNGCASLTTIALNGNNAWSVSPLSLCQNQEGNAYLYFNTNYINNFTATSILPTSGALLASNSSFIFNPTATTIYTITSSVAGSCQTQKTVTIIVKNISTSVSALHANPSCPLTADGNIAIISSPANANLTYQWLGYNNPSAILNNLYPNIYEIYVQDTTNGECIYLRDTIAAIGTSCGNIIGQVIIDSNNNCASDVGESGVQNVLITANPGAHQTFTNANGEYAFNGLSMGNYTLTNTNNLTTVVSNCGVTINSSISSLSPIDTVMFYDTILPNPIDLVIFGSSSCISFPQNLLSRPFYYWQNNVTTSVPAIVYAVFDSIQQFSNSVPAYSSISGDTVFWSVSVNNYLSNINILYNIDSTTPVNYQIHVHAGIIYNGVDVNINNNLANFTIINCLSYDPNDKAVTPAGIGMQGYIPLSDSVFTYLVRFQNTGTAPAVNIAVEDTISNNLNINSLKVLQASHNYFLDVENGNMLRFRFPLIMLPDSNANEPESHGYILYQINKKPNAIAGDQILNTANIYFDYNSAVVTNTTTNTFYDDLRNNVPSITRNTSCNTPCGNGKIVLNPTGGVSPFTHSITPSCSITIIANNNISGLAGGTYAITTTDAIGNTTTLTVPILNPVPIILNLASVQPVNTLGSASVAPTGGTPPYDYLWLPGNYTTASITNLQAGNYSVSVLDANGCSQGSTFSLNYALGIPTLQVGEFVNCFPNPALNIINVSANFALGNVIVFNNSGQILIQQDCSSLKNTSIDLQGIASGNYYIQMGKGIIKKIRKE